MSVSASIPATVQIRRGHLLGLIGVAAALAACVTAAVTAVAFDTVHRERCRTRGHRALGVARRAPRPSR